MCKKSISSGGNVTTSRVVFIITALVAKDVQNTSLRNLSKQSWRHEDWKTNIKFFPVQKANLVVSLKLHFVHCDTVL